MTHTFQSTQDGTGSPVGSVTPDYTGQIYMVTDWLTQRGL